MYHLNFIIQSIFQPIYFIYDLLLNSLFFSLSKPYASKKIFMKKKAERERKKNLVQSGSFFFEMVQTGSLWPRPEGWPRPGIYLTTVVENSSTLTGKMLVQWSQIR